MTGKVNDWQLGALNMQTICIAEEGISPYNFTAVLRTSKFIDPGGQFLLAELLTIDKY
ncbi:MAG: hypothetical protein IPI65_14465 [Bacteroidetes bacterium]|nr:hypothetical protein [Bacteroidota bacterium]